MELDDVRRLTGANILWDRIGAAGPRPARYASRSRLKPNARTVEQLAVGG